MKRLVSLITSLALITALVILPVPLKASINSVQALQVSGRTFCTSFSINEQAGYWATAAHCAVYALEEGFDVTINGEPAYVVYVGFPSADVAVFRSTAHAPAYKLSHHNVSVGDDISIIGYPYGIARTQTFGHVAAISIPITHPSTNYTMFSDILDITTAGGNSGSPVIDSHGEIVGILWGGFIQSPHSLSVTLTGVEQAIGSYFK